MILLISKFSPNKLFHFSCHSLFTSSWLLKSFALRVSFAATLNDLALASFSTLSKISCLRVENSFNTSDGIPLISQRPFFPVCSNSKPCAANSSFKNERYSLPRAILLFQVTSTKPCELPALSLESVLNFSLFSS